MDDTYSAWFGAIFQVYSSLGETEFAGWLMSVPMKDALLVGVFPYNSPCQLLQCLKPMRQPKALLGNDEALRSKV